MKVVHAGIFEDHELGGDIIFEKGLLQNGCQVTRFPYIPDGPVDDSGLALITTDHGPMNEFLDPACGSGVNITRLYSRHDGYYWPLCNVDEDHLREVMQQYVDQRDRLPTRKLAAREFAERQLDWHRNAAQLPALFREVQQRHDDLKESAMALAQIDDSLWATPVGEIISQIRPLMTFLQGVVRLRARLRQGNLRDPV